MSGDLQPRKRKDKKRKKEEGVETHAGTHQAYVPLSPTEDVTIHVHKEEGTGGGICAKIIFFMLFSALFLLIGLIITEHRGQTELDSIETESKYSQLFKGWIHEKTDHDDHVEHDVESLLSAEHDVENHADHESQEHDEEEKHSEESIDEQESVAEEDETSAQEEDDAPDNTQEDEDDDNTAQDDDDNTAQDDDDETAQEDQSAQDEESQDNESVQKDNASTQDDDESDQKDDDSVQKDDESPQEDDKSAQTEDKSAQIQDKSAQEEDTSAQDDDESTQKDDLSQDADKYDEVEDEQQENQLNKPTELGDDDESAEKDEPEEKEQDESDEQQNETKHSEEDEEKPIKVEKPKEKSAVETPPPEQMPDEAAESEHISVVKIGVGVAIVIVAYTALCKRRTVLEEAPPILQDVSPDLSRRNTFITPPPLSEIQSENVFPSDEYSDEENDIESEEDIIIKPSVRENYQALRSSYERSLSPESDAVDEYENEEVDEEEIEELETDDEEDYENEEYDDEEGEELLKKIDAKYGFDKNQGGPESNSDNELLSDTEQLSEGYDFSNITNNEDWNVRDELDEGQANIDNNSALAIKQFNKILEKYPFSPRALYGKASALEILADKKRSNSILEEAIHIYEDIINLGMETVPHVLFLSVVDKCVNKIRFLGQYDRVIMLLLKLIPRYPKRPEFQNQLAITYLITNKFNGAKVQFAQVLQKWPNNGCALVHYGFILKNVDNNMEKSVQYLQKGIETQEKCTVDTRFYYHLGDALQRLGRHNEAMKLYEEGVRQKLFKSKYQRSVYNVDRLTARPWWEKDQTPFAKLFNALEKNWMTIRDEGLAVLSAEGFFMDESENLRDTGKWKQFQLFGAGKKNQKHCKHTPVTCQIIQDFPDARNCKRGQTKFSVMHPGTHVWSHCGPTNCRLRLHLGLKVPSKTYIRVGDQTRTWHEGQILLFDDSFEHEVWHNGTDFRLVLIVDLWHPELTPAEKRELSPI